MTTALPVGGGDPIVYIEWHKEKIYTALTWANAKVDKVPILHWVHHNAYPISPDLLIFFPGMLHREDGTIMATI